MINKKGHFSRQNKKKLNQINNKAYHFKMKMQTHQIFHANGLVYVLINIRKNIFFGLFAIWPVLNLNILRILTKECNLWKLTMHLKNYGKEDKKIKRLLILQSWILQDMKLFIEAEEQDQSMEGLSLRIQDSEVDKNIIEKEWTLNHKILMFWIIWPVNNLEWSFHHKNLC